MNDVEIRLRAAMQAAAPERVDVLVWPRALGTAPERYAARRGPAALLAVLAAALGTGVLAVDRPSTQPARPGPPATVPVPDAALCSVSSRDVTGLKLIEEARCSEWHCARRIPPTRHGRSCPDLPWSMRRSWSSP